MLTIGHKTYDCGHKALSVGDSHGCPKCKAMTPAEFGVLRHLCAYFPHAVKTGLNCEELVRSGLAITSDDGVAASPIGFAAYRERTSEEIMLREGVRRKMMIRKEA